MVVGRPAGLPQGSATFGDVRWCSPNVRVRSASATSRPSCAARKLVFSDATLGRPNAILRPMLDNHPCIPPGYDGWRRFQGIAVTHRTRA
ncbi:hypothetical protein GCM10010289_71530 [Streptomyces violascens]|nr:hypothetical protein GCM10010289_71530 [Streptomyces violascens]